eukprot:6673837-Prymnesium_polylepis.1
MHRSSHLLCSRADPKRASSRHARCVHWVRGEGRGYCGEAKGQGAPQSALHLHRAEARRHRS